jgi:hypothetical protein
VKETIGSWQPVLVLLYPLATLAPALHARRSAGEHPRSETEGAFVFAEWGTAQRTRAERAVGRVGVKLLEPRDPAAKEVSKQTNGYSL